MTLANLTGSWALVVWEISVVLSQVFLFCFFFFLWKWRSFTRNEVTQKPMGDARPMLRLPWVSKSELLPQVLPWALLTDSRKNGEFPMVLLTSSHGREELQFWGAFFFFLNKSNFLGIWRLGFEVASLLCKWFLSYLMRELLWLRFLGNIRNSDTSSPHEQM